MNIDGYQVLVFLHILAFGYWLGADLGVYFCDSQMTRADLDIEERLRVRRIRYKVDMAPRTCFVLILALGFTLAQRYGSPVTGAWLGLLWAALLAWLALIWSVRIHGGTPRGAWLGRLDRTVWFGAGLAMMTLGGAGIAGQVGLPQWLAAKMFVYGLICWNGLWIMGSADHWYPLIEALRRGDGDRDEIERRMKQTRFWCGTSAFVLWFLVLVVAFLGTVKPI
ncbi:MAG: hypothetical protein JNM90_16185 [Burkholderiales bacterium]|nr:hypothetical protein [Burkholderiales bacterium]